MTQTGVFALTVYNGEIIAGGMFDAASGQIVNHIARWDGAAWQPWESGGQVGVGDGYDARVYSLTVHGGDLIAGGTFTTIGGKVVNRIARWDGTEWHPFASDEHNGILSFVDSLGVEAVAGYERDLFAAGNFYGAEGQAVHNIARWDGSQWHPVQSGGQIGIQGELHALLVHEGELIAGGYIETAGGQAMNGIARWDGTAWHTLTSGGQTGVDWSVRSMTVLENRLIVGGNFHTVGGQTANRIAVWDGCLATQVVGDINADGVINVGDVTQLAVLIDEQNPPPASTGDINGDGVVDGRDVHMLAELVVNQ